MGGGVRKRARRGRERLQFCKLLAIANVKSHKYRAGFLYVAMLYTKSTLDENLLAALYLVRC